MPDRLTVGYRAPCSGETAMSDATDPFAGAIVDSGSKSSSSSGTRTTKEYKPYSEANAEFILSLVESQGSDVTIPLKDENAREVTDAMLEALGLEEGPEYLSVESIAPFDIEADYIGTPVNVSYEQLEASVEAGVTTWADIEEALGEEPEPGETYKWAPEGAESTPQSDLATCLNGFYSDDVISRFGEEAKMRVGTARRKAVSGAHERYSNVRFFVSTSSQAPLGRERARVTVGELEQSDLEQWAEDNGFSDKV